MPRPLLAVLGWAAATAAAVAVAHMGVDAVAGRVVDPLPPSVDVTAGSADDPAAVPTDTAAPPSNPSAPDSAPREEATGSPAPSEAAAPAEVRSYALVGGTATLRFAPGRVTVVSAEPSPGFVMDVEGDGTAEVRVEFDSDGHRSRLRGSWDAGPRERVDEDVRDDDADDPVDPAEDHDDDEPDEDEPDDDGDEPDDDEPDDDDD